MPIWNSETEKKTSKIIFSIAATVIIIALSLAFTDSEKSNDQKATPNKKISANEQQTIDMKKEDKRHKNFLLNIRKETNSNTK